MSASDFLETMLRQATGQHPVLRVPA
jgi:hypothetical protein